MFRKTEHTTPALKQLHWLPIEARIIYKICLHCHNFFHATSPAYFSELLTIYTPARSLRSSQDKFLLSTPLTRTKTYGERSFSYTAPTHWNSLPYDIRQQKTLHTFKKDLKTYLFAYISTSLKMFSTLAFVLYNLLSIYNLTIPYEYVLHKLCPFVTSSCCWRSFD